MLETHVLARRMAAKLDGESDIVSVDNSFESGGVGVCKVDIGQSEDRGYAGKKHRQKCDMIQSQAVLL
jgi:hypothetical protein